MAGLKAVKWIVFGASKTDLGLGWAGMANSGKYSETIEMA
jgi:hypothetical protein